VFGEQIHNQIYSTRGRLPTPHTLNPVQPLDEHDQADVVLCCSASAFGMTSACQRFRRACTRNPPVLRKQTQTTVENLGTILLIPKLPIRYFLFTPGVV